MQRNTAASCEALETVTNCLHPKPYVRSCHRAHQVRRNDGHHYRSRYTRARAFRHLRLAERPCRPSTSLPKSEAQALDPKSQAPSAHYTSNRKTPKRHLSFKNLHDAARTLWFGTQRDYDVAQAQASPAPLQVWLRVVVYGHILVVDGDYASCDCRSLLRF